MKNFDWRLTLAIGLPVIFIVILVLLYVLPSSLAKPTYDFLYGESYNSKYTIEATGNKITATANNNYYSNFNQPADSGTVNNGEVTIKRYHVNSGTSSDVTVAEANQFQLSTEKAAPDGFIVTGHTYDSGIIPMVVGGSDDYNSVYLTKGTSKKKLNLTDGYNFRFLAWIIQK